MNFLIVSRISIPAKDRTLPCWNYLRSLGHTVTVEHPDSVPSSEQPDVIICMGVTIMTEAFRAIERWPGVPLMAYNWDVYRWIWEPGQEGKVQAKHKSRPNEYNYLQWGDLLRRAREVWVPSHCTGLRTTQWYGLTNWRVILSACPWWEYEEKCKACDGHGGLRYEPGLLVTACNKCQGTGRVSGIRDDGYALMCLREIPDPWWGVFEECCEELGIPYRCTRHEVSYREYQEAVAHCRFLCAPLYELSTGGLSLMEGYYHGKPVLISSSPWNGGADYFGPRAYYFEHGNCEDFKQKLLALYNRPTTPIGHREYITENFSDQRMVDDMVRAIAETS